MAGDGGKERAVVAVGDDGENEKTKINFAGIWLEFGVGCTDEATTVAGEVRWVGVGGEAKVIGEN